MAGCGWKPQFLVLRTRFCCFFFGQVYDYGYKASPSCHSYGCYEPSPKASFMALSFPHELISDLFFFLADGFSLNLSFSITFLSDVQWGTMAPMAPMAPGGVKNDLPVRITGSGGRIHRLDDSRGGACGVSWVWLRKNDPFVKALAGP